MAISRLIALVVLLAFAGCSDQPASTAYQHIDSGINAINGGGENSTGEVPSGNIRTVLIP